MGVRKVGRDEIEQHNERDHIDTQPFGHDFWNIRLMNLTTTMSSVPPNASSFHTSIGRFWITANVSHLTFLDCQFASVSDQRQTGKTSIASLQFCLTLVWTVQPALHHVSTFYDIDRRTISHQLNIPWNRGNLYDTNSSIVSIKSS
jgi:hypothetical protein